MNQESLVMDQPAASFPCWDDPSRYGALKLWANELAHKSKYKDGHDLSWDLVGRAVMIVNDSEEYTRRIVHEVAKISGYQVLELEADNVFNTFATGFDEVREPTIFLMKQGVWSVEDKNHVSADEIRAFQENFPKLLGSIPNDKPLVFVTHGKEYISLVEDLRTVGAFDRRFFIDDPSLLDRASSLFSLLTTDLCGKSLLDAPAKVGQLLECEVDSERRIALLSLALRRLAHREKRKIEYMDLVHYALHGTAECSMESLAHELRHNIAVHEAGHALISILDSSGLDVPDYAGIVPTQGTLGQVSASYSYLAGLSTYGSYKHKRHIVRVLLGGRAAEHLVLGVEAMSITSARGDLRHATNLAKELVGRSGISPTLEDDLTAGSNLLIRSSDTSDVEKSRIESDARLFLSRQYDAVCEMMKSNLGKIEVIAQHLLQKNVLTQEDLMNIMAG